MEIVENSYKNQMEILEQKKVQYIKENGLDGLKRHFRHWEKRISKINDTSTEIKLKIQIKFFKVRDLMIREKISSNITE